MFGHCHLHCKLRKSNSRMISLWVMHVIIIIWLTILVSEPKYKTLKYYSETPCHIIGRQTTVEYPFPFVVGIGTHTKPEAIGSTYHHFSGNSDYFRRCIYFYF